MNAEEFDIYSSDGLRRRSARLYEQLAASPLCEVTGIVSPSGVGGGQSNGDADWEIHCGMFAWRIGNGPLQPEEITLRWVGTREDIYKYQELMREETIVKVAARVSFSNVFCGIEGWLENLLGIETGDEELNRVLADLQSPKIHFDDQFGDLVFERRFNWCSGKANWGGSPIQLCLDLDGGCNLEAVLAVARRLWNDEANLTLQLEDHIVRELLDLLNDDWREPDEPHLTRKEFLQTIKLTSISVYGSGGLQFLFDDGELFGRHVINVDGSLSEGITCVALQG